MYSKFIFLVFLSMEISNREILPNGMELCLILGSWYDKVLEGSGIDRLYYIHGYGITTSHTVSAL